MEAVQDHVELKPFPSSAAATGTHRGQPTTGISSAPPSHAASSLGKDTDIQSVTKSPPSSGSRPLPIWKRYSEWWLELAGALSSITLLAAIITFLIKIDGSKLDDWHPEWQIKPATVISVLVTLCRITLAFIIAEGIGQLKWVFFEQRPHQLSDFEEFDEATRGPWGAVHFMWRINRRALVASSGALMALLVLAMDPFSQQVLYYAPHTANFTQGTARLPAANIYDSGALAIALDPNEAAISDSNGGPAIFGQMTSRLELRKRDGSDTVTSDSLSNCSDTLMARAAYSGVYGSVPPLDFACSSGNCTWPSSTTLGICSRCNNITSQVKASCNDWGGVHICWYESPGRDLPGAKVPYPGPDARPMFNRLYDSTPFQSRCLVQVYWPLWLTWASSNWDKTCDLLSFTSYRFPKADFVRRSDCKLPLADVEQCTLFWCAKTFETVRSENNRIVESPSTDVRLVPFDPTKTECAGIADMTPPYSDPPLQGFIREDRSCPNSAQDLGLHDVFWVNKNDHTMTVNLLAPMIDKQEMALDQNGASYDKGTNAGADAALLTALWDNHAGNISLTMADIATAMTNRVRTSPGNTYIVGVATTTDTVIKVTWYWLIYIVGMVGLSLAFFITAVIFASEKSKVVWKSSSLAVLMHGLSGFEGEQIDWRSVKEMGKAGKELWAKLEVDKEGALRLVKYW